MACLRAKLLQLSTLCKLMDYSLPVRLLCPWDSLGKNARVGPPPGDLSDSGIKLSSLIPPALAGGFFTTGTTWEAHTNVYIFANVYIYIYAHK